MRKVLVKSAEGVAMWEVQTIIKPSCQQITEMNTEELKSTLTKETITRRQNKNTGKTEESKGYWSNNL